MLHTLSVCGLAALAAASLAQPVVQPVVQPLAEAQPLLDPARIAESRDGEVPVVEWVLEGGEPEAIFGGLRGCAPFREVGSDPEGDSPSGIAFAPDGSWFVVSHRDSQNLLVYDAATRSLLREIPLSGSPAELALSSDGRWVVTPNLHEHTASVVDMDAGLEVAVIPVGQGPITARITPDGATALVGSLVGDDVSVIDLASGTEIRRIGGLNFGVVLSVNFEAFAVAFACANPLELAGNTVAVFPDTFNDRVGFVDIATGAVTFAASDDAPRQAAVTADGTTAVVSHAFGDDNTISIVDIAGESIARTIDIGTTVWGPVSVDPAGSKAVVAVQNAVRVVNLSTDTVSPNLDTASVNALRTTADGLHALCVGYRGSLISYASESIVRNLNNVVSTSVGGVSPADSRAVMLATTFGEDMVVVDTDGASGGLEEVRPSGPPPEGDKPRTVAVTPDGSRVVTTNQFSRNVSVFDTATMSQLALVDVGLRPGQVRVTPDGTRAVVTNRDDPFLSVIDLNTFTRSDVAISTRGDQLRLSPDGTYAYIAVVVSDGVWRVNLDTMSVEGAKLPTGEMGGVGYTGNQFSGIALSEDGSTLVACNSFDDTITVIDAGAWSVVATVGVGDFPSAATFSPDGARIYVTNRNDDTVSVVTNAGSGSTRIGTISVGDGPYTGVVSDDSGTLYVMNTYEDTVSVVDTALFSEVDRIAVDETPIGLVLGSGTLFVGVGTASVSTNGESTQLGQLALVDTASNTVVETLCADYFLSDIAADADASFFAAAGMGGESAVFFDLEPCRPDLNGDGQVNTQDFIVFLNFWSGRDAAADWNDDGNINTQDFIAFLNDWVDGC